MQYQTTSKLFSLLLILSALLSSCGTTQEELWIEADGSGRFESTMNLSALYPFILMGIEQEDKEDEPQDPMTAMIEQQLKKSTADTTFSIADLMVEEFKATGKSMEMVIDSLEKLDPATTDMTQEEIDASVNMLKTISDMQIRLRADQVEQRFTLTTISTFEDLSEFQNSGSFLDAMMKTRQQATGMSSGDEAMLEQMSGGQTSFELRKGKLNVLRKGQSDDLEDVAEEEKAQMQMMQGMMGDAPYRLTIHFPGKVKKVASEYAEQTDKKTVVIEIPQDKLKDEDFELDLGIKFKGLRP